MLLNRPRAITYMEQCGLDALVATSPINVTYLTDYCCWLDPLVKEYMVAPGASVELRANYAILARGGEGGLVIRPAFALNFGACWVRQLRLSGPPKFNPTELRKTPPRSSESRVRWELFTAHDPAESPEAALATLLQEMGLADAQIGLEFEGLANERCGQLESVFEKSTVRDCSNLLRLIRMVKSDQEQQRLRRCAQINEAAAMSSLAGARAGTSIQELIRHYRVAIARDDATFDHYAYSMDGLGIATQVDYKLREGDVAFVDFGCIHDNQFSDTGTTLMIEPTCNKLVACHAALKDAIAAGQTAAVPGVTCSTVHQAMVSVLDGHGLLGSPYGHSLGLEIREYPVFLPDHGRHIRDECIDIAADLRLEPGMVFNLETPLYLPPTGAFQVEQTFLMTDQGCNLLIEHDRSTPVISLG